MRFTIRQLCFVVFWIAFVLGAIRLADAMYTVTLAALSGMALYFMDCLFTKWKTLKAHEIAIFVIAIAASIGGTAIGVTNIARDYRSFAEQYEEMQARVREDPRFANVICTYSGVNGAAILTVSGHVASEGDLAALRSKADEELWRLGKNCTMASLCF